MQAKEIAQGKLWLKNAALCNGYDKEADWQNIL